MTPDLPTLQTETSEGDESAPSSPMGRSRGSRANSVPGEGPSPTSRQLRARSMQESPENEVGTESDHIPWYKRDHDRPSRSVERRKLREAAEQAAGAKIKAETARLKEELMSVVASLREDHSEAMSELCEKLEAQQAAMEQTQKEKANLEAALGSATRKVEALSEELGKRVDNTEYLKFRQLVKNEIRDLDSKVKESPPYLRQPERA